MTFKISLYQHISKEKGQSWVNGKIFYLFAQLSQDLDVSILRLEDQVLLKMFLLCKKVSN